MDCKVVGRMATQIEGGKGMKSQKLIPLFRGLSSVMVSVMTLSIMGSTLADSYRSKLDDALGTQSYITLSDEESAKYVTDYETIEDIWPD